MQAYSTPRMVPESSAKQLGIYYGGISVNIIAFYYTPTCTNTVRVIRTQKIEKMRMRQLVRKF